MTRLQLLYEAMEKKGVIKNKKDFSEKLNITYSNLTRYLDGTVNLSIDDRNYRNFMAAGVNLDWFLCGEGEMFVKDEKKDLQEKTVRVPLLRQSVSCGPGQDWAHDDNIEDFIELGQIFPVPIKNVYAFRAAGESMIGAGIRHGDILFFDGSKNQELGAGGIFVFGWNGDAYCKLLQFERLSNTIRVYSYEKSSVQQAEFIRAIKGDDESLVIFGRVLGWMHENTIMPLYNNVGKLLQ